jgi:4-hydroxybenzoate polyprenyltransferase
MLTSAERPSSLGQGARAVLELGFRSGLVSALFVCGFQPLLALLLTRHVDGWASLAMLTLVWQSYLLDRLRQNPEDALDDSHPAAFSQRFRVPLLSVVALLAVLTLLLVAQAPRLARPVVLSLFISAFYLVPLPIFGRRAKEVPYFKCFYLSLVCLASTLAFSAGWSHAAPRRLAPALGLTFALYFLNFSLYDVKDVEQDRRAGIKTLAGALPLRLFLRLHIALSLAVALLAIASLPLPHALVLAAVALFHASMSAWLTRSPLTPTLCGLIDTGYAVILGVGALGLAFASS